MKRAARDEGIPGGPLTIGSLETTAAPHLSALLASYAAAWPEVGIAVPRVMEFGSWGAIFGCVAAGPGIGLLPRALIGPVWREGRVSLHTLPAAESQVSTVFIHRWEAY